MSVIVKTEPNTKNGGIFSIVKIANKYFYVNTAYTYDHGWETMAFPCNEDGDVSDWGEVAADWYENMAEAFAGHTKMSENLEEYLYEDDEDDYKEEELEVTIDR